MRPGLTPPRARDVLLVLTAPQLFVQFTRELGWSTGELAAWITTTVLEQVFATTQEPAPENLAPGTEGPPAALPIRQL